MSAVKSIRIYDLICFQDDRVGKQGLLRDDYIAAKLVTFFVYALRAANATRAGCSTYRTCPSQAPRYLQTKRRNVLASSFTGFGCCRGDRARCQESGGTDHVMMAETMQSCFLWFSFACIQEALRAHAHTCVHACACACVHACGCCFLTVAASRDCTRAATLTSTAED